MSGSRGTPASRAAAATGKEARVDIAELRAALAERVDGEVRFDPGTLAHVQDASNYRQVPIGVAVPPHRGRGRGSRGRVPGDRGGPQYQV